MEKIIKSKYIVFLILFFLSINFLYADDNSKTEKIDNDTLPLIAEKIEDNPSDITEPGILSGLTPSEIFNLALEMQQEGKLEEAVKEYTKAVNLSKLKPEIRSKAYQNMGVMQHLAARELMQEKPEETLSTLDKTEGLYKEAMRSSPNRPEVAINQQVLINDRRTAKDIIKKREEMKKKHQEAIEKTKEALEAQQETNSSEDDTKMKKQQDAHLKSQISQDAIDDYYKAAEDAKSQQDMQMAQGASQDMDNALNDQNQNNGESAEKNILEALKKLGVDQDQQNQQNQQDQNQQQNQDQEQNQQQQEQQQKKDDAQQKTQDALDKQQDANQEQDPQEKEEKQQDANQKTQEAKDAMDDYKDTTEQNQDQQSQQSAEQASQNLQDAQQAQDQNDGQKAEEDIQKALEEMQQDQSDQQDKNEDEQNQPEMSDQIPEQPQTQPQPNEYDNSEIDPKQAEALLKLMSNDEQSLRDELKERRKEAYGTAPVEKDW